MFEHRVTSFKLQRYKKQYFIVTAYSLRSNQKLHYNEVHWNCSRIKWNTDILSF